MDSLPKTAEEYRRWWEANTDAPYGTCWCLCGGETSIAKYTLYATPRLGGEPTRYLNGHAHRPSGPLYTVEDRGYETECWIWQRATAKGYGYYWRDGTYYRAHRWFYENTYGPIPDGLQLDHLCRVHGCVNPSHLDPVSSNENTRRGASPKLSIEKARQIRTLKAEGYSAKDIAKRFGVVRETISNILGNRTWKEEG